FVRRLDDAKLLRTGLIGSGICQFPVNREAYECQLVAIKNQRCSGSNALSPFNLEFRSHDSCIRGKVEIDARPRDQVIRRPVILDLEDLTSILAHWLP